MITFNKNITQIEDWKLSAKEFMFWTLQNWNEGTLITISPSANTLLSLLKNTQSLMTCLIISLITVYLKADGKKFIPEFSSISRDNSNEFGLSTVNTADGIFSIKIPTVQKEHVVSY